MQEILPGAELPVLAEGHALMGPGHYVASANWIADPPSWCDVGPWQEAHPWSPWRLFGYDLWREAREDPHGLYTYPQRARSQTVAREMLHSAYGGERPDGANHTGEPHWGNTPLAR